PRRTRRSFRRSPVRRAGWMSSSRLRGEGSGVHLVAVLEVEVEPVRTRGRDLGGEADRRARGGAVVRVNVQVAEVAGAEDDEVAVGGEVARQVGDRAPVLADGEGQLAFLARGERAVQRDRVAVDGGRV